MDGDASGEGAAVNAALRAEVVTFALTRTTDDGAVALTGLGGAEESPGLAPARTADLPTGVRSPIEESEGTCCSRKLSLRRRSVGSNGRSGGGDPTVDFAE